MNKEVNSFREFLESFTRQLIKKIYNNAPFDKTFQGRIVEVKKRNKYIVLINGENVTVSAYEDYAVGDIVWVTYPQNKSSNAYISFCLK